MHYRTEFTWKTKEDATRFMRLMARELQAGDVFDEPAPECLKIAVREVAENED